MIVFALLRTFIIIIMINIIILVNTLYNNYILINVNNEFRTDYQKIKCALPLKLLFITY